MFDTKEIPVKDITVGTRARQDTGDIESLRFSVDRHGLLNPITVDENYQLVAGERRLAAVRELNWETVSARIVPGLSPADTMVIEWIENVERVNFTWIEDLELKKRMHETWKTENEDWGYRATAAKLGVSLGGLSSDLALAEAIDYFPALKEYKTKSKAREGYKRLNSSAEAIMAVESLSNEEQSQLKSMLENSSSKQDTRRLPDDKSKAEAPEGKPITEETAETVMEEVQKVESDKDLPEFSYEICSYESFMGKIPAGIVGFAELDPPYAIDYSYHDEGEEPEDADWSIDQLEDAMDYILSWLIKNMMIDSWVLCWTGYEHTHWINEMAKDKGFSIQPPGIWYKPNGGRTAVPSVKMKSNYEHFLLFRKGKALFNTPSFGSVISSDFASSNRVHKWEKPIELYNKFFAALGRASTYFLSPFAGSGNAMVASTFHRMTPLGCDKQRKHFYSFYTTLKNHYMSKEVSDGK